MQPAHSDSSAARWFSVASPKSPPNVMIGDSEAKYKKAIEARHWMEAPSVKSDQYLIV